MSHKGAIGLMQIMPSTGKFLAQTENMKWTNSKDILYDPINNVRLGCLYLSSLVDIYGVEGGDEDVDIKVTSIESTGVVEAAMT
jgi:hypothetical protein